MLTLQIQIFLYPSSFVFLIDWQNDSKEQVVLTCMQGHSIIPHIFTEGEREAEAIGHIT